jgi:hypothetical protein
MLQGRRACDTSRQSLPPEFRPFQYFQRRVPAAQQKTRLGGWAQAGFCCNKSGDTYSRAFGTTIGARKLNCRVEKRERV